MRRRLRARCAALAALLSCATAGAAPGFEAARAQRADPAPAGRQLAAARQLALRGEVGAALAAFAEVAARHPQIADFAELERLRLSLAAGELALAREIGARWARASTPWSAEFDALAAELALAQGDAGAAIASLERARQRSRDPERRAELGLRIGELHAGAGRADAAAAAYRAIWSEQPGARVAAEAERQLQALESAAGRELRGASDYRRRGDACFSANRNEEALQAYEALLQRSDATREERARAASQRAETLFRLRLYPQAAAAFAALPRAIEQQIAWARSIARAGEPLRGARELARIARSGRGVQAERARLLAALLHAGEGESAQARALLQQLAARGRSEFAREARWQLAWSEFSRGRDAEAARGFRRLAAEQADPLDALRSRYWEARALERSGDARGVALLEGIARDYPLSYYGWRAGLRLAGTGARDLAPAPVALAVGSPRLGESEFERAQILLEAGYLQPASLELAALQGRARSLQDRLRLAQLFAEVGDFHGAQRLVVDAYGEPLARGPELSALDLWWHAWPQPYASWVRGSTVAESARGLRSELVYAIMREESGYRPAVLSISGARGLLQLMPDTARRVAAGIALVEFQVDDLFAPPVNIRLGAAYLAELLARFEGRTSAAIAGYNAGPEAVARWLRDNPAEDDVWVEAIPYDQTRSYVKRVLRSLHAYRVLY